MAPEKRGAATVRTYRERDSPHGRIRILVSCSRGRWPRKEARPPSAPTEYRKGLFSGLLCLCGLGVLRSKIFRCLDLRGETPPPFAFVTFCKNIRVIAIPSRSLLSQSQACLPLVGSRLKTLSHPPTLSVCSRSLFAFIRVHSRLKISLPPPFAFVAFVKNLSQPSDFLGRPSSEAGVKTSRFPPEVERDRRARSLSYVAEVRDLQNRTSVKRCMIIVTKKCCCSLGNGL